MQTVARPSLSVSSHWYDPKTKEPRHFVPKKDGTGNRPTTIADARKNGWLPSVSHILRCIDKPALNNWRIESAVLAAMTTPRRDGEDLDAFIARVLSQDAEQEAQIARDFGILIHDQIEGALNGHPVMEGVTGFVNPVLAVLKDFGSVRLTESIVFGDGYAGTLDALFRNNCLTLVDIKTTKAKTLPKESYLEHRLQLAAYANALGNTRDDIIKTVNVYVSSVREGEISVCENDDWKETFNEGFKPILSYWKWANNF